jgi:hypothetical protein
LARRDGGKHRPDNGEVDCSGTAVPDASLTDVEVSKLAAMGVEDIGAHHIEGERQIGVDVVSIASHGRILRNLRGKPRAAIKTTATP